MALPLRCPCGAAFEVEDTFAGQTVGCPECGAAVKAPPLRPQALRTSGFAVASAVVALVGAFTLVGTLSAAILGVVALVSIARQRDRLTGAGYAVFGLLMGVTFTVLTGFALTNAEVFDRVRDTVSGIEVDRSGPLEVVRKEDGFAITRPSRQWGVATPEAAREMDAGDNLVLAHPAKDAYIEVLRDDAGPHTLEQYREQFLDGYRKDEPARGKPKNFDEMMTRFTNFQLRESRRLPPQDDCEVLEVLFDVKLTGQNLTYRARLIKPRRGTDVYVILAWAHRRRLPQLEDDVRKAMDSFRLLRG